MEKEHLHCYCLFFFFFHFPEFKIAQRPTNLLAGQRGCLCFPLPLLKRTTPAQLHTLLPHITRSPYPFLHRILHLLLSAALLDFFYSVSSCTVWGSVLFQIWCWPEAELLLFVGWRWGVRRMLLSVLCWLPTLGGLARIWAGWPDPCAAVQILRAFFGLIVDFSLKPSPL